MDVFLERVGPLADHEDSGGDTEPYAEGSRFLGNEAQVDRSSSSAIDGDSLRSDGYNRDVELAAIAAANTAEQS